MFDALVGKFGISIDLAIRISSAKLYGFSLVHHRRFAKLSHFTVIMSSQVSTFEQTNHQLVLMPLSGN